MKAKLFLILLLILLFLLIYLTGVPANKKESVTDRRKFLNPLEMLSSNFSVSESRKSSDYAIPYLEEKGTVRETSFLKPDRMEMGPAGSINSVESFEPAVGKIMFNRIPNKK